MSPGPKDRQGLPVWQHRLLLHMRTAGPNLPSSWSDCAYLKVVDISNNSNLVTNLPDSWGGSLVELQTVSLTGTTLTGTLPTSWGLFPALVRLDLAAGSTSQLVGTLPTSWVFAGAAGFKVLDLRGHYNLTGVDGVARCTLWHSTVGSN